MENIVNESLDNFLAEVKKVNILNPATNRIANQELRELRRELNIETTADLVNILRQYQHGQDEVARNKSNTNSQFTNRGARGVETFINNAF